MQILEYCSSPPPLDQLLQQLLGCRVRNTLQIPVIMLKPNIQHSQANHKKIPCTAVKQLHCNSLLLSLLDVTAVCD